MKLWRKNNRFSSFVFIVYLCFVLIQWIILWKNCTTIDRYIIMHFNIISSILFSKITMTSNHLELDSYEVYSIRTKEIEVYISNIFFFSLLTCYIVSKQIDFTSFLIIEGLFNSFAFSIYLYIYIIMFEFNKERQSRSILVIPKISK